MTRKRQSKSIPTTVRFTAEERAAIEDAAGHEALSSFIRDCTLKTTNEKLRRKKRSYNPDVSRVLLAQILALLGKSRASGALREVLDLARMGALPVTEETENTLNQACDDVSFIKQILIKALGLKT